MDRSISLTEVTTEWLLLNSYEKAKADMDTLEEAILSFTEMIAAGDSIYHKKYGNGIVKAVDEKYIAAEFKDKNTEIGLAMGIANKIITIEKPDFSEKVAKYIDCFLQALFAESCKIKM